MYTHRAGVEEGWPTPAGVAGTGRKAIFASIPAERWPYAVTTALHPKRTVPSPQGGILRDPRREEEPTTVLAGAVTPSYQRTSAPPPQLAARPISLKGPFT